MVRVWFEAYHGNLDQRGRIEVNGEVATLGMKACAEDHITMDGVPCQLTHPQSIHAELFMLHKPLDTWCTKVHSQQRPSVFQLCQGQGPWFMVGRLDVKTTGLLLFSNYAPWAHELMHPKFNHERRYQVTVRGRVTDATIQALEQGVMLEDGEAKASKVIWQPLGPKKHQCIMSMHEGRHRIVRRMWHAMGCHVTALHRVAYAGIELPSGLAPGQWLHLKHRPSTLNLSKPKG